MHGCARDPSTHLASTVPFPARWSTGINPNKRRKGLESSSSSGDAARDPAGMNGSYDYGYDPAWVRAGGDLEVAPDGAPGFTDPHGGGGPVDDFGAAEDEEDAESTSPAMLQWNLPMLASEANVADQGRRQAGKIQPGACFAGRAAVIPCLPVALLICLCNPRHRPVDEAFAGGRRWGPLSPGPVRATAAPPLPAAGQSRHDRLPSDAQDAAAQARKAAAGHPFDRAGLCRLLY